MNRSENINQTEGIVILDFGSQYNQLIARRIRELGVYSEILPYYSSKSEIEKLRPKAIILSGGPSSVFTEDSYQVSKEIFQMGIPVLGICYGMQLTAHLLGGKVIRGEKGEYGKTQFNIQNPNKLFADIPNEFNVWMSRFDQVTEVPSGFQVNGSSTNAIAAFSNELAKIYCVQFHPEVLHTEFGSKMLENFTFLIANCNKNWKITDYIQKTITKIKEIVGDKKVILGLSGGVDSSVAAVLIHKAIGNQLKCIFVDHGLLRKNEAEKVELNYGKHLNLDIKYVNVKDQFLEKLKNVSDPEEKRKVIGKEFIEVFNKESNTFNDAEFLAQGTIYPDVIESISVKGPSATIKSHHNVGGLPKDMKLQLLEPLRELFKDEVRKVGIELGIPKELVYRHPFPGPGLGIRILGEISDEKIKILQEADDILIQELYKNDLYDCVSQAFVVLLPVKSVGVMGDQRTYEYTAVVRCANTLDFMTATWTRLPYDFLESVSSRIINEVKGINRVTYDISSKPPATIEWE